jgi:glucose/arabinose dehydrogenase
VLRALVAVALVLLPAVPADAAIRGPKGIDVQKVARGLGHPTALAFDPAGGMWTTSAQYGVTPSDGVWYVKRRGARARHVVRNLNTALGLTWFRGKLFVSHVVPYSDSAGTYTGRVTAFSRFNGRRFKRRRTIVKGIPTGQHRVNNIVPGPGGRLYLGVGTTGDTTAGSRYGGTVVSFRPGGGGLRIEARGLRNPYGLAFVPGDAARLGQWPRRPRQLEPARGVESVRGHRRRAALRVSPLLGRGRRPLRRDAPTVRRARSALRCGRCCGG